MPGRKQRVLLLWYWVFLVFLGIGLIVFMRMFPPPSATWSAQRLAEWYQIHSLSIRIGASIFGLCSGALIPLAVLLSVQARRLERGAKVWSSLILVSVSLSSIFMAMPALAFGTAAYSPYRAAEITQIMHEFGVLTLVTTDQLYIFGFVAVAVMCFITPDSPGNPFARWFGWATTWMIAMFEFVVLAFLFKTGPFAINGIISFWLAFCAILPWSAAVTWLTIKALKVQDEEELAVEGEGDPGAVPASLAPAGGV